MNKYLKAREYEGTLLSANYRFPDRNPDGTLQSAVHPETLISSGPHGPVILELLVSAITPTPFILLYIYREDRYEPEPSRSLPGFSWRPYGLRSAGKKTRRDRTGVR